MFIVSMGIPHKDVDNLESGKQFVKAVIQVIDWKKKKIIKEICYTPPHANLGNGINKAFKGACLHEDQYYVVSHTELLQYDINNWNLENVISHPTFNDLHDVYVNNNYIYLCNTGLESVQILKNGKIQKTICMAETPIRERFPDIKDFRMIPKTEPHEIHINKISFFNNDLWVTRFQKRDAVALYDKKKRIEIPLDAGCHDGQVLDNSVFFTTINGHIFEFDIHNLSLKNDYDISSYFSKNIGWVRGLEIHEGYAYLGITELRYSKLKEYARGLIRGNKEQRVPSSIIKIDLKKKQIVDMLVMSYNKSAIYSILRL